MLKKRIIGMIAVENGLAVQSFGYKRTLPLGRPARLAENLDRWGVDEIIVLDFGRSRRGLGPDMDLISELGALGLMTPLSYGGGISTVEQAIAVIKAGVERICIDSLLHHNPDMVIAITQQIGAQAVVAAFPVSIHDHTLKWYDHCRGALKEIDSEIVRFLAGRYISEVLLIDWQHEGEAGGFNPKLLEMFAKYAENVSLLLYGGISDAWQVSELLKCPMVSAVCIGNFLNYREHAFQTLKKNLDSTLVRPLYYAREHI